jgi:SAM-dependent MidA family methyltransferase
LTGRERRAPYAGLVRSIIFSNELLDAMPAHRFGWDATTKTWFEWGVTLREGRFVWERMGGKPEVKGQRSEVRSQRQAQGGLEDLPVELLKVLPDGFTIEFCPESEQWSREAADVLGSGKLLTIDYGLAEDEFFAPERKEGTLRAYRRHRFSGDVLANPGDQDITTHVNFAAIQRAGEAAGLKTDAFLTQAQFLTRIAAMTWTDPVGFGEWTAQRKRQFQTLTHPEHLGRAFRVLVQSRSARGTISNVTQS